MKPATTQHDEQSLASVVVLPSPVTVLHTVESTDAGGFSVSVAPPDPKVLSTGPVPEEPPAPPALVPPVAAPPLPTGEPAAPALPALPPVPALP